MMIMLLKIAEKFNSLSGAHQRYRQTTDGLAMTDCWVVVTWLWLVVGLGVMAYIRLYSNYRSTTVLGRWPCRPASRDDLADPTNGRSIGKRPSPQRYYRATRMHSSYECHALTFLSSCYLMLLSTCILLCANKHGWMDGWTMPSQDVCPSVCPSHAGILSKQLYVSSNISTIG